ncbi:MAG: GNAT family N-acetyltransferase, partial [bacterium]
MKDVLHSERLRLTALNASDAVAIAPWFERDEFARFYDTYPAIPLSAKDIAKTIEEYNEDDEKLMLGLRMIEDDRLIGLVGFTELLWSNQVGTIFVGLGDSSLRGKGYASEAVRLVIEYSFSELNLHRLQLYV